jgi:hypothetical protein
VGIHDSTHEIKAFQFLSELIEKINVTSLLKEEWDSKLKNGLDKNPAHYKKNPAHYPVRA